VLDASSGRQSHHLDISQDLGQAGCMLNMFIQPPGVYSVAMHPDGRRVATLECGQGQWTPRVRDLQTGEVLLALPSFDLTHFRLRVAFSPNGSILWVPTPEGTATLHDATSGEVLHILQHIQDIDQPDETVTRLVFDPGGDRIATAGTDGMAVVWDLLSGERLFAIDSGSPEIWALAYNLDGTLLATGAPDGKIRLWDARTGQALRTLPGSDERVNDVNFNPTGTRLAATAAGILYVWDLTPDHELFTYQQTAPFYGLELSADGSRLATADTDGEVGIFDPATGTLIQRFRAQRTYIVQATFNPVADHIATAGGDGIAKIFDSNTGEQLTSFDTSNNAGEGEVTTVDFSPDGQRLATINPINQSIGVWDISSGRQVMSTTTASTFGFGLIRFDPQEGRLIATQSHTRTVILDPTSGRELLALDTSFPPDGLIGMAVNAEGDQLAGGGFDGTVITWDSHSGEELLRINAHEGPVWAMVYSQDGNLLATGGVDGTVKIWDAASGVLRLDLGGNRDAVSSIEFSLDGKYLYTAGYDGSLRGYVLSLDELIALAKSRLTRSFTPDECRQYRIEPCPVGP
jgi:WD40 repeat protein